MELLLDTHVFIWFLNGNSQLPVSIKNEIVKESNKCFISMASIWEMAIKISLGKLELQGDFLQITGFLNDNNIEVLPIAFAHLQQLLQLEYHHRDPFDRIIIAQALSENLTIATRDTIFNKYDAVVIW